MSQVVGMRLFGRKKKSDVKKSDYDIFGGATVTRVEGGYEVTWRSPNLTSVRLASMPKLDEGLSVKREGDTIHILSPECKLTIISKNGETEAYISKM